MLKRITSLIFIISILASFQLPCLAKAQLLQQAKLTSTIRNDTKLGNSFNFVKADNNFVAGAKTGMQIQSASSSEYVDAYEPNDNLSTAYFLPISHNNQISAAISYSNDIDCFGRYFTANKPFQISLQMPQCYSDLDGSLCDYNLYLLDGSGRILTSSTNTGFSNESITASVTTTGYLAVVVAPAASSSYNISTPYTLSISDIPTTYQINVNGNGYLTTLGTSGISYVRSPSYTIPTQAFNAKISFNWEYNGSGPDETEIQLNYQTQPSLSQRLVYNWDVAHTKAASDMWSQIGNNLSFPINSLGYPFVVQLTCVNNPNYTGGDNEARINSAVITYQMY